MWITISKVNRFPQAVYTDHFYEIHLRQRCQTCRVLRVAFYHFRARTERSGSQWAVRADHWWPARETNPQKIEAWVQSARKLNSFCYLTSTL